MKIEHIISTMHRTEFSFLEQMNLHLDGIVVNQGCEEDLDSYQTKNGSRYQIYSTLERGLSRSRNMLIEKSVDADICIIADDDVEYRDNYETTVHDAYKRHPDADIIVFCFSHEKDRDTRVQYTRDIRIHMWNISKAASVEITFKRDAVVKAGLHFNDRIGLGATYPSGEENAFLADALRAGLKIYHVPKTTCFAVEEHALQTQNEDEVENYLVNKGAAFHCAYKNWFFLYALGFILLKKKTLFQNIGIWQAWKCMRRGKQDYLASMEN